MQKNAGRHTFPLAKVLITGSLVLFSFFWFTGPARYVLIANQDRTLLLTTPVFFLSVTDHPGGLLEYTGNFLAQILRFPYAGALLVSALVVSAFFPSVGWVRVRGGNRERLIAGMLPALPDETLLVYQITNREDNRPPVTEWRKVNGSGRPDCKNQQQNNHKTVP